MNLVLAKVLHTLYLEGQMYVLNLLLQALVPIHQSFQTKQVDIQCLEDMLLQFHPIALVLVRILTIPTLVRYHSLMMCSYDSLSHVGKGPAFSVTGRQEQRLDSLAPGPGAYSPDVQKRGPAYSMSGRTTTPITSEAPGPGAYHYDNQD